MSVDVAHDRAVALLEIMESGLDAPRAVPHDPPEDAVDAYALLFRGRYADALAAMDAVDDGAPGSMATRAQLEALCLGTIGTSLRPTLPADTVAGAVAVFQLSEAAHVVGRIDTCVGVLRNALEDRVPTRVRPWLRLALVRALLFRGDVPLAADELARAARDARSPLARRSVSCLNAVVAGSRGRAEAVVAEAATLRRQLLPARTYADAGISLMCALGLASVGMVMAAGELLRDGGGGPGLPLLPPTLRGYAYDVLIEAALAAANPELAAWIMVDFDRIDFGQNVQFRAAREAARARIEIAAGAAAAGMLRADHAAREAIRAGVGLVGARAAAVAAGAGGAHGAVGEALRERRVETEPAWAQLTRSQQAVARLAAQGLRNQQIADTLVLSRRTVEGHLSAIFDRLGVADRVGIVRGGSLRAPDPAILSELTPRQAAVACELVTGARNDEIAARLGIGVKTVEKHLRALYRTLGVSGRAAAVAGLLGEGAPPLGVAPEPPQRRA